MQNISSIGYLDFVKAPSTGAVDICVHQRLATHVMATSLIPNDYRLAYRLWTWIWLSLVPVALVVGSLYSWWWTPAIVLLLVIAQSLTSCKTASMFVVDYAREDELFYDIMVQLGVMRVSRRAQAWSPLTRQTDPE